MWSDDDMFDDSPLHKLLHLVKRLYVNGGEDIYNREKLEDVMEYAVANNRNYILIQTDSGEHPIILNSVREFAFSVFNIPNVKPLLFQSKKTGKVFGVCTVDEMWMQINLKECNKHSVIIGNIKNQDMRVFEEDELGFFQERQFNLDGEHSNRLNDKNEIWNGKTVNGQPFGFGFYSRGEHRVFEGFEYNGNHVCFGKLFSCENGRCEYEGGFCNGTRCGPACIQYDENGAVQYEGDWLDQSPFTNNSDKYYTSTQSTIHIYNNYENGEDHVFFISPWLARLVELTIFGQFNYTTSCKIEHVQKVLFLFVQQDAFNDDDCPKGEEGVVCIRDCPNLSVIEFGRRSFYLHKMLELSDLPELNTIHIGASNFMDIKQFIIKGDYDWLVLLFVDLPKLNSIHFGDESVHECDEIIIESM